MRSCMLPRRLRRLDALLIEVMDMTASFKLGADLASAFLCVKPW